MFQQPQQKTLPKPKAILGLTTLAVVGSGLYATSAEASSNYTVTASSLNVRSGPGTNHAIIGGLSKNQTVSVSSISNGWATISYNGRTAYVSSSYLSETSSSSGNSSSSTSSSATYYVTASSLNVRSGAGTNHSVIGGLRQNQTVSVSSIASGWATISYNGRTAYVSASHLSETSSSSGSNSSGSTSSSSTYYVTASSLNVRSGAGTSHSVIGSLSQNQSVSVSSIANGWATISYNGRTAYVSTSYLSQTSSSSGSNGSGSASSSSTYYVTASSLNVRSGAGTTHSVIGSLSQNQSVSVSSIANGWATISYNGRTAYVSASYLSGTSSSSSNSGNSSSSTVNAAQIVSYAQQFMGVPYVWGGSSPSGFDCSGFIYYVLRQNGVSISRTNVAGYWRNNSLFQNVSSPQAGDIIFFQNTYTSGPSHIGFMINSTQFIHASSSGGVTITNISNSYWRQHFLGYKRLK